MTKSTTRTLYAALIAGGAFFLVKKAADKRRYDEEYRRGVLEFERSFTNERA